jgi:hypothetical protein
MPYAAVEIKQGETTHATIKTVMDFAVTEGCVFASLELLGVLLLGRLKFIRFRTESKTLQDVLLKLDRGVVYQHERGYFLRFPGEAPPSPVNILTMTSVGEPGIKRTYRGPGVKYWERQFL